MKEISLRRRNCRLDTCIAIERIVVRIVSYFFTSLSCLVHFSFISIVRPILLLFSHFLTCCSSKHTRDNCLSLYFRRLPICAQLNDSLLLKQRRLTDIFSEDRTYMSHTLFHNGMLLPFSAGCRRVYYFELQAINNSFCSAEGTCRCVHGFTELTKRHCVDPIIGRHCDSNVDCAPYLNHSQCSSTPPRECTCITGYYSIDNFTCQPVPGMVISC